MTEEEREKDLYRIKDHSVSLRLENIRERLHSLSVYDLQIAYRNPILKPYIQDHLEWDAEKWDQNIHLSCQVMLVEHNPLEWDRELGKLKVPKLERKISQEILAFLKETGIRNADLQLYFDLTTEFMRGDYSSLSHDPDLLEKAQGISPSNFLFEIIGHMGDFGCWRGSYTTPLSWIFVHHLLKEIFGD